MEFGDRQLIPKPRVPKAYRDPFEKILYEAMHSTGTLEKEENCYEFQAILDDQLMAREIWQASKKSRRFSFQKSKQQVKKDSVWNIRKPTLFRADSIGIVYSDIIPLGRNCVILELRQDEKSSRLNLAPGRKNQNAVNISLYKGEGLIEKFQLLRRIHWELDRFEPGDYRLVLGKQKSFQFVIQG